MPPPLAAPASRDRLDFPAGSARCARRGLAFVRTTMARWRIDADSRAVDDALLVTAELLANAADHAGGPLALDVRLDPDRRTLRIAVTDALSDPPRIAASPPADQPHGRGLRIIDRLANAWGTSPAGAGKTVWAELGLPPADHHRPPRA
ncbi:ATP-binding protein [Kitasatospora sp. NPDC101157]|uniref:ATP-binding protein n=1 Tax=Kitasatospora sp. NPDC101157 TaxID=3364098 RepID=UPI00382D4CB3